MQWHLPTVPTYARTDSALARVAPHARAAERRAAERPPGALVPCGRSGGPAGPLVRSG